MGSHPVALVEYTFTHKKYTERQQQYIEQHKHFGKVRAMPQSLGILPSHCPYN